MYLQDEMERLEENQEKIMNTIGNLRYRIKNMEQQNIRIENMLKTIMTSQGIDFEDEDAIVEEQTIW